MAVHTPVRQLAGVSVLILTIAILAATADAPPAGAELHHPTGAFAPFADCPLENPVVLDCLAGITTNGELKLGDRTVPFTRTSVSLQGGVTEAPETDVLIYVGPEDGNVTSKTPIPVPGGLSGAPLPNLPPTSPQSFESGPRGGEELTATMEVAEPPSAIELSIQSLISGAGTAVQMPVKIRLNNPLLGEHCYIGSASNPIVLQLTTGETQPPPPNTPIKGHAGELKILDGDFLTLADNSLVSNSFAVPAASGCGSSTSLLDQTVDAQLGLPAAAGHSTLILNGNLDLATVAVVRESE
jgi:hypothetical protein